MKNQNYSPFREGESAADEEDQSLVRNILDGDRVALDSLILRHQSWIYNVALKMVWEPKDAEDVTQEILIKMISRLGSYRAEASFRTWLFRIVKNHVLNMKRRPIEDLFPDFPDFARELENLKDAGLPASGDLPVDLGLIIEETEVGCMTGMLACLKREERLIVILGYIFGVTDVQGAEIFEMSRENFRQKLSRSRRRLVDFLNQECGLVRTENPCRCEQKVCATMDAGYVDPNNLRFTDARASLPKIRSIAAERVERWDDWLERAYADIYRGHSFLSGADFVQRLKLMIQDRELNELIDP
ncbi:MAG: RNA polymerase sigma factor [Leptospirales bacterium]|jgi:RNA polymerase sigma factor (sigma-70 family)